MVADRTRRRPRKRGKRAFFLIVSGIALGVGALTVAHLGTFRSRAKPSQRLDLLRAAVNDFSYLHAVQRRRDEYDPQFSAPVRRMPLDHVLAFAWCQNYLRTWNVDEPIDILKRFIAHDPDDRWSRLALATNLRLTHELDQSETTLVPMPDSDPDARALRVELAIDRGEIEAARALALAGSADHVRLDTLRGRLTVNADEPTRGAGYFRVGASRRS